MPSVILGDKLVSPGNGNILTKYNHRIEMPTGTEAGDCKTEFSQKTNKADLSIYLNGNKIGNSEIVAFSDSYKLDFKTTLNVQYSIEAKHYQTFRWCCKKGSRGCRKYCEECRYASTETRNSQVNLEDSKQLMQYRPVILPEIKSIDNYRQTNVGILNISKFDAFELKFEDSSFGQSNYFYDINFSIAPYNIYTLSANREVVKESSNINVENLSSSYKFYVANPNGCLLRFYDHFHSWEKKCDIATNFTEISLETEELQYDADEVVKVELFPKNTEMKVKYGNEIKNAKDYVEFKAIQGENKVTAILGNRETQQVIYVRNKEVWKFAIDVSVFSGTIYIFYLILKKYVVPGVN